MKYIAFFAD